VEIQIQSFQIYRIADCIITLSFCCVVICR